MEKRIVNNWFSGDGKAKLDSIYSVVVYRCFYCNKDAKWLSLRSYKFYCFEHKLNFIAHNHFSRIVGLVQGSLFDF